MKPSFWLSPSKLENFRSYRDNEMNGFFTEEKVIEQLTGATKWSPQATFGTAFHAVIEHGPERYYDHHSGLFIIKEDDMPSAVVLHEPEILPAIEFRNRYPLMKHESWIFDSIDMGSYEVVLIMKADGIHGLRVHENKTSTWPLDIEKYERSLQWKIYCHVLRAQAVVYNHFYYRQKVNPEELIKVEYNEFYFIPHDGILDEIRDAIDGLVTFAKVRGLGDYLFRQKKK